MIPGKDRLLVKASPDRPRKATTIAARVLARLRGPQPPRTEPHWIEDGVITRPIHVVCSPYKTGTTSVGKALVRLGVGQRDMTHNAKLFQKVRPLFRDFNARAVESASFRAFARDHGAEARAVFADLLVEISAFDVFHDAPIGHGQMHVFLCKVLAPQARFIWVRRARADWLRSVRNWEETHPDIYPRHGDWARTPKLCAQQRVDQLKQQHRQFKRIRRYDPASCLELNWSDLNDWTALARFYGVEPPEAEFPRFNISESGANPPASDDQSG